MAADRTHDVGSAVENRCLLVDDLAGSPVVHLTAAVTHRSTRLSSTPLTAPDASVHGECVTLSPASTDAKTMDDKLYLLMDNDKSDQQVDFGDNRRVERSDA
jgi:hypothetical protein